MYGLASDVGRRGRAASQPRAHLHGTPGLAGVRRSHRRANRPRDDGHRGGALVLSWQGGDAEGKPIALAAIALACLGWAVDNNLTRKIALTDPVQIAALKGAVAGMVNVALALSAGAQSARRADDRRRGPAGARRLRREPRALRPRAPRRRSGPDRSILLPRAVLRRNPIGGAVRRSAVGPARGGRHLDGGGRVAPSHRAPRA